MPSSPSPIRTSSRTRAPPPPPLSLEAALDEERREVMAALEGNRRTSSPASRRAPGRTATPPPQIRSMLDIDSPIPRHGSIAGIGVGITAGASLGTSPTQTRKRLNPADPSTYTSRHISSSANTSPVEERGHARQRSTSESAHQPSVGLPKIPDERKKDFDHDYQFDMTQSPTTLPQQAPLRVTQGGAQRHREGSASTAMAAALSGDFSSLHVGMPRGAASASGRHNSTAGIGGKSKSPSSRIRRTESPGGPMSPLWSPSSPPGKYVTESGKTIDMSHAYRRLSNKSGSGGASAGSFSTIAGGSEEGIRVEKDILEDGDEAAVESSEEEYETSSSEEDPSGTVRGRRPARRKKSLGSEADWEDIRSPQARESKSQMAAAEEERIAISSAHPVSSLLEPSISVTAPSGQDVLQKNTSVHPNNAFDHPASAVTSQASSDGDPEISDIVKARKLGINVSAVDSNVPDRVVQIILRGDWQLMQQEADDGRRRQRLYLVATDLSDEAVYALEWTIGTILRDGDTLLAIYAIEDENAGGHISEAGLYAEATRAGQDAERTMESLTKKMEQKPSHLPALLSPTTSQFQPATESRSVAGSVDARRVSKAQMERLQAVDVLQQKCLKLLRKTRLQVRVMVEVIHCKRPSHLITAAIDELEPTLVVLGSRGRSALKGVLLGSFSNYLVTKSSVPVMVARKKLKKHAKMKATHIRLTNNLQTPSSPSKRRRLDQAKIELNNMPVKPKFGI